MNARDLVTLQNVRDWLNTGSSAYGTGGDALLARMVTAASAFVGSYLQRQIQPTTYAETYSGNNQPTLFLRNRPVLSVSALTIDNAAVQARTTVGGAGYVADASRVYLDGRAFCRGVQNVSVTYRAGLQASDMLQVPNGSPYTVGVATLSRPWNSDQGVAYGSGAPLTKVTDSPVAGEYKVTADAGGTGLYTFAAADANAPIVLTYGYTPEDLVQAIVELVGERFKSRNRIGENSQNIGNGQVVSFSQKDMGASIKTTLDSYRNLVPV